LSSTRTTGRPSRIRYEELRWPTEASLPVPGDVICHVFQDEDESWHLWRPQQVTAVVASALG
jgi:hypothetical protein